MRPFNLQRLNESEMHMSPNVPHGARSIGEVVVLRAFAPIRADWKD